jgi:hypothetical protein
MKAGGIDTESSANGLTVNMTLPLVPNTTTVETAAENHAEYSQAGYSDLAVTGMTLIIMYTGQHFLLSLRTSAPGSKSVPLKTKGAIAVSQAADGTLRTGPE